MPKNNNDDHLRYVRILKNIVVKKNVFHSFDHRHHESSPSIAATTTTALFSAPPPLIVGSRTIPRVSVKAGRKTRTTAATTTKMGGLSSSEVAREKKRKKGQSFSPSAFIKAVDESSADTFDEASCRALLAECGGDGMWASFDERWAAAVAASASRNGGTSDAVVTKRQVLTSICSWPPEVFDGTSGTRAEARAVNDEAEAAAAGTPHFYELDPEQARVNRRKLYAHSQKRRDVSFGTTMHFALWMPSQEKWPAGPRGTYLLFHGGGWVFGDAAGQNDTRLEAMCEELGIVVLVPDYRKAPEHPYPAPLDDCEAAAAWVEDNAGKQFGPAAGDALIIGGESAGGNLCAAVLLRRRDFHSAKAAKETKTTRMTTTRTRTRTSDAFPWRLANLVYGIFDVAGTPSVDAFGDRRLVETTEDVRYFGDCYCPDTALRVDSDVSPLRGDLTGLPPAIFTVGTEDALADDTLLMFDEWRAAGNQGWLDVWPDGPHGVGHFGVHAATPLGLACRAKVHRRIGQFLDGRSFSS